MNLATRQAAQPRSIFLSQTEGSFSFLPLSIPVAVLKNETLTLNTDNGGTASHRRHSVESSGKHFFFTKDVKTW